jgi:maltose alpha-D-glucosyltransferase/alpha-amylase
MKKTYWVWFFYLFICFYSTRTQAQIADTLWYKGAIFYSVDVEVFQDSDNDGTGDFNGLISRLNYIESLGITALWLAPFQPTPNKDDGYDVSDYYGIDKRLGTLEDFKHFIKEAEQRHIHVIMDLVVNHTSNEHPWFQQARRDTLSPYRNWYVWSKKKPKNIHKGMVFPGVQESIWTYDSMAGAYYYHRFYDFQPDLNMQNPEVQTEVKKIIAHWIGLGINGFRLDGVPFFIEVPETHGDAFERQFTLLNEMCAFVKMQRADAIVLGEANVPPAENKNYFGKNGEGLDMIFNFFVNQQIFYTLATTNTKPLKKAINKTRTIPANAQWGEFLRNHDEVDLGRLSPHRRKKVYKAFGPKSSMQLYKRGIRRRLAPMLNNDRLRMELAYSLMLSLPGTPVLRYGDEIGMGDNLSLKERLSVRTPMQWSSGRNGGFSSADSCVLPVIDTETYGYKTVQVEKELLDSTSFLNWTKQMLLLRKTFPEISMGTCTIISTGCKEVLALQYIWQGSSVLILNNFSNKEQDVKVNGCKYKLGSYGYEWDRL